MPTKATLTLEGFEQYLEDLQKAGEEINTVAADALGAGGGVLVGGMKRRAPFELLANAVGSTGVMVDGNKVYLYVGVLRGTDGELVRIANVWEFGGRDTTSPRYPGRKPRPGIVAHPFIRPALRSDWKGARNAMVEVFKQWLNK